MCVFDVLIFIWRDGCRVQVYDYRPIVASRDVQFLSSLPGLLHPFDGVRVKCFSFEAGEIEARMIINFRLATLRLLPQPLLRQQANKPDWPRIEFHMVVWLLFLVASIEHSGTASTFNLAIIIIIIGSRTPTVVLNSKHSGLFVCFRGSIIIVSRLFVATTRFFFRRSSTCVRICCCAIKASVIRSLAITNLNSL